MQRNFRNVYLTTEQQKITEFVVFIIIFIVIIIFFVSLFKLFLIYFMLDLSFYENFTCFLSHFYFLSSTGGRSDTALRTGFSANFSNFFMFPVYLNFFLFSFSFLPEIMSDQHYFSGKDDR